MKHTIITSFIVQSRPLDIQHSNTFTYSNCRACLWSENIMPSLARLCIGACMEDQASEKAGGP